MKLHQINPKPWSEEAVAALEAAFDYMGTQGIDDFYIVGGFLRDTEAGLEFKDADIFIPGNETIPEGSDELEYDLSTNYPIEVGGFELNIIHMHGAHTLDTLLTRCDVGICQIGMKPDRTVWATQEYLDDVKNQTLTVTRKSRYGHLVRVCLKFPEHEPIGLHDYDHQGHFETEVAYWKHIQGFQLDA